jgi:SAM-dependent methyltransferase
MKEPFLSQFREQIRLGASSQDVHDTSEQVGYAATSSAVRASAVEREVNRVEAHRKSLLPLLECFVGPLTSVLDVGCSTGGTTVGLALSKVLRAKEVVGVDPNLIALEAARVRAKGYDVEPGRIRFDAITPKESLPYSDCQFDLTTCVSVLEFVSEQSTREALATEIQRVTRPGGYIFIATPSPWRAREFHSRRLLGHVRRRKGYPWSSTPSAIRRMFSRCEQISVNNFVVRDILDRRRIPGAGLISIISPLVAACLPWQKHLFRKRSV